ncbi:MAG: hypothetical protein IT378_14305, partial [Sandaracinaceae bacterium]|nr:hypothetical protein [Sandaracinaceae bacterium]
MRSRAVILALALALSAPAAAQRPTEVHVRPPPAPEAREPELLIGVHLGFVAPVVRSDICPGDTPCVLGGGAVVGAEVERRWAFGLGVLVGYDLWFVEAGGVFELGVVQLVRAGARYTFDTGTLVHPSVQIGAGALVFGDTFLISTVGGEVELGAGCEIELTDSVGLSLGARGWIFTTSPFTTGRDR